MKKNRIMICGRKTSTLPTPPIAPSTSSDRNAPSGIAARTPLPARPTPHSTTLIRGLAQRKTDEKTTSINRTNTADPQSRCVRTRSSPSPRVTTRCLGRWTTPSSTWPAQP